MDILMQIYAQSGPACGQLLYERGSHKLLIYSLVIFFSWRHERILRRLNYQFNN